MCWRKARRCRWIKAGRRARARWGTQWRLPWRAEGRKAPDYRRASEVAALTLAGAERGAALLDEFIEAQQRRKDGKFSPGGGKGNGIEVGEEQEHLAHGQALVEPGAGGNEADAALHLVGMPAGA